MREGSQGGGYLETRNWDCKRGAGYFLPGALGVSPILIMSPMIGGLWWVDNPDGPKARCCLTRERESELFEKCLTLPGQARIRSAYEAYPVDTGGFPGGQPLFMVIWRFCRCRSPVARGLDHRFGALAGLPSRIPAL